MRLTSKGLGRMALPFSLGEAAITNEEGAIWFRGRIKEKKVNWDYRMRLDDADIVSFVALARDRRIVDYVAERQGPRLLVSMMGEVLRLVPGLLRAPKAAPTGGGEKKAGG